MAEQRRAEILNIYQRIYAQRAIRHGTDIDLLEYGIPEGWEECFTGVGKECLQIVGRLLGERGEFYPPTQHIFNAYWLTPPSKVKVVIVGQDPYPQKDVAMGLSFSTWRELSVPGSLRNIYKELARDYPDFIIPEHGDLSSWSLQGVLLLNMCLTVAPGKPGAHKDLWLGFMNQTFKHLLELNSQIIFVLWGNKAQSLKRILGNANILEASHPSPINTRGNFIGCGHFSKINKMLISMGAEPINWHII